MYVHKKFSVLSFVVFLSLVLSLVFPIAALADDSTPPPPAAPAADNGSAQTSSTDSSTNVAAPADGAPADAAPTDAAPKDVAPTEVAPTDSAATDAPSNSTNVAPTDSATTNVPASSTDVSPTDSAATNVPSSSTEVAPTDSVATDVAIEPTAAVVAALNVAGAVLLDENNNPIALSSQQAADVLSGTDPWFDIVPGVSRVGYSLTASCAVGVTECHPNTLTPIQDAINDSRSSGKTVFVEQGTYNEDVTIAKQVILTGLGSGATANSFTLNGGANTTGSSNIFAPVVNVNAGALIQNGVDLAADGGTVNVGPGNYPGQVLINNKNITLQATAPGAVIQAVASMPDCYTNNSNPLDIIHYKPVICVKKATNVIIKGLTVDGRAQGDTNNRLEGIYYFNAGGTVQGNTIEHIRDSTFSGTQAGVGMYAYNLDGTPRTLNVFGNNIFDYQKNGMALSGNGLTVNVQNNTVTGAGATPLTAQNGIQVSYGASGTISGNTVSGNFWTGTYGGSNDPISDPNADSAAGILIYQPGSTTVQVFNNNVLGNQFGIAAFDTPDFNIHNNTIQGIPHTGFGYPAGIVLSNSEGTIQNNTITINDYGVLVFDTPAAKPPVGIHNNSITANTLYGVWSNKLTDATYNWWGDATGPLDSSGVTDACGLTLSNPTGTGGTVSPCVLYEPWLTADPFPAAGNGGDSGGGNGRGQNATLTSALVIPVTGGQPTTLSCSNPSVTMQIGDIQVTFTGLCGYDVVLNSVAKENLPGDLGSGNSFDDGLSITLLKNGKEIKTLPADASIQVSYPKPASGSPSVLVWTGSTWVDQASFVDGNNIISKMIAPATLVLVTH